MGEECCTLVLAAGSIFCLDVGQVKNVILKEDCTEYVFFALLLGTTYFHLHTNSMLNTSTFCNNPARTPLCQAAAGRPQVVN